MTIVVFRDLRDFAVSVPNGHKPSIINHPFVNSIASLGRVHTVEPLWQLQFRRHWFPLGSRILLILRNTNRIIVCLRGGAVLRLSWSTVTDGEEWLVEVFHRALLLVLWCIEFKFPDEFLLWLLFNSSVNLIRCKCFRIKWILNDLGKGLLSFIELHNIVPNNLVHVQIVDNLLLLNQ